MRYPLDRDLSSGYGYPNVTAATQLIPWKGIVLRNAMMADGPTQHHLVTVWQCSYIKIADLLVVFFKNWQADVVTWEIRVTSKDILPKKSSQNDFSQLTLWLLSLSSI